MRNTETTIADIHRIINQVCDPVTDGYEAAEEIVYYFGWQPIQEVPMDQEVDLLSNGAIRFCNCHYDKKHGCWVSKIQYMDENNLPRTLYNKLKGITHYMLIPKPFDL